MVNICSICMMGITDHVTMTTAQRTVSVALEMSVAVGNNETVNGICASKSSQSNTVQEFPHPNRMFITCLREIFLFLFLSLQCHYLIMWFLPAIFTSQSLWVFFFFSFSFILLSALYFVETNSALSKPLLPFLIIWPIFPFKRLHSLSLKMCIIKIILGVYIIFLNLI